MKSNNIETIYIDLDCLLDTRLATLGMLSEDAATNALNNKYHERESDFFKGIDLEEYKILYKNRNVMTLKNSMCTNAVFLLRKLINDITEQSITMPYYDGVKIIINTYPYELSNKEKVNIEKSVRAWVRNMAPVDSISISKKNLTPYLCKSNFSMLIMYEYAEWLDLQAKEFENIKLPDRYLFAPALYFSKVPTEEELKQLVKESNHPFHATEIMAQPLISLKLIDIKYFSIIDPKLLVTPKKKEDNI